MQDPDSRHDEQDYVQLLCPLIASFCVAGKWDTRVFLGIAFTAVRKRHGCAFWLLQHLLFSNLALQHSCVQSLRRKTLSCRSDRDGPFGRSPFQHHGCTPQVDFCGGKTGHRSKHQQGKTEQVVKAAALPKRRAATAATDEPLRPPSPGDDDAKAPLPLLWDLTAGLGTDAFLLAQAGWRVEMFERSPVVAALVQVRSHVRIFRPWGACCR